MVSGIVYLNTASSPESLISLTSSSGNTMSSRTLTSPGVFVGSFGSTGSGAFAGLSVRVVPYISVEPFDIVAPVM